MIMQFHRFVIILQNARDSTTQFDGKVEFLKSTPLIEAIMRRNCHYQGQPFPIIQPKNTSPGPFDRKLHAVIEK